jgi:hypothetical protein
MRKKKQKDRVSNARSQAPPGNAPPRGSASLRPPLPSGAPGMTRSRYLGLLQELRYYTDVVTDWR